MSDLEFLELEDLLELLRALGMGPVRDLGLLDAACARPRSTAFGRDAYASLEHKAAALLHSLVSNHTLMGGNKRLGWPAALVFLDLNGHAPAPTGVEAFELVMAVAGGMPDVSDIAVRRGRGQAPRDRSGRWGPDGRVQGTIAGLLGGMGGELGGMGGERSSSWGAGVAADQMCSRWPMDG